MTAPAVYLASKSPRREELLRQLGVEFASLRLRESSDRERDIVEGARDAEPRAPLRRAHRAHEGDDRLAADAPTRSSAAAGAGRRYRGRAGRRDLRQAEGRRRRRPHADAALGPHASRADGGRVVLGREHRGRDLDVGRDVPRARVATRSSATSPPASRSTRPARTPSRAAPRRSCSGSKAATPASWVCRSTRRRPRSPASGSPCYNHDIRCRMKSSST